MGTPATQDPRPLTLEEQEDLEDQEANRAADAALAEMERTGRKPIPLVEVLAKLGLDREPNEA
jgi:hypothetical protein